MQFDQDYFQVTLKTLLRVQDTELPLHFFTSVASTNQKLWELLNQGNAPPRAVIAIEQTAGKGQWGRQWQSLPGGLYLSIALSTDIRATNSNQLTLCSAWGIAAALRQFGIPVYLKWPNDLLLLGRKLGGILCETRVQEGKITQAVIGVGINWTNPVLETGINLQSWFQGKSQPGITCLSRLGGITAYGIFWGYQQYLSLGIEPLLSSYLEMLSSKGKSVIVNDFPGVVVGVTSQGELKIRLYCGKETKEIFCSPGTISLGYR